MPNLFRVAPFAARKCGQVLGRASLVGRTELLSARFTPAFIEWP